MSSSYQKKNEEEKHIWKVISKPGDFTEEELKKKVSNLINNIQQNENKDFGSNEKNKNDLTSKNETPSSINNQNDKEKTLTLGELIQKFLIWYQSTRKPKSYKRYNEISRIVIKFFRKDLPVTQLNNGKVEEYKLWRLSQGVKPITINKELRFLSTMINRAVEFEWISEHKLYKKPVLIKETDNQRLRYLTEEEEKKLLEAIKNPLLKDIVIFALNTGMRKNEILNLKWTSVNFNLRSVILEPHETKNKRRHILPLNKAAWEVIERRYKEKADSCEFVFHRNGKPIRCIKEGFKTALRKAGITDFRFHDLRHTFASRLIQKGVDLYVIKELLNPTEITTTQRYAHLRIDNLRKAVARLGLKKN